MVAWRSPPAPAGGGSAASSIVLPGPNRKATIATMDRRHDPRTEELNNLKLALAAFALQLAAFEIVCSLLPSRYESVENRSRPAPSLESGRLRVISVAVSSGKD